MTEGQAKGGGVVLAILAVLLGPFLVAQVVPHGPKAQVFVFGSEVRVATNSSIGLARIFAIERQLPYPLAVAYRRGMPPVRKYYFFPLGRVYCAVTGRREYRFF